MASPIAVTSALPDELELLVDELAGARRQPLAAATAWHGRLRGRQVVLAESGIGKVDAALVATSLIERTGPRALLFGGVAGGVDPGARHRRRGHRDKSGAARHRRDHTRRLAALPGGASATLQPD